MVRYKILDQKNLKFTDWKIKKLNNRENLIVFLTNFCLFTYKYLSFDLKKLIYFSTYLSTFSYLHNLFYIQKNF